MGLMAFVNLIGILALSGVVKKVTVDYLRQVKAGKQPTFDPDDHKEIGGGEYDIWKLEERERVRSFSE